MNVKMILFTIGHILRVMGVLLLLPLIVSLCYGESTWLSFLIPILVVGVLGTVATWKRPENKTIQAKEGLVIVGLSWILMSLLGCLPFFISREIPAFIDAFFETVSGFTTTGASILAKPADLTYGMLFWRSFTHWIGGMGVLVFVLAIIPNSDIRAMHIFRAETTGYKIGKLVSKLKSSARILYGIYVVLTFIEVVFLLCGGMGFFDSVTHSFATAGTGGFSTKNNGITEFNSVYIEMVLAVFMFIFGINFQIFYLVLIRNFSGVWKSEELRCYFGIVIFSTILIACNILGQVQNFGTAMRFSFFQVTSLMSTTGFVTINFTDWPLLSKTILFMLMLFGSCAGSTAGGMKVSRVLISVKSGFAELKRMLRPRSVVVPKFDCKPLEREEVADVNRFLLLYLLLIGVSFMLLSIDPIMDFETALTTAVTGVSNVGPCFGAAIGPLGNMGGLTVFSKIVFCFDMLAGRLELFPIIMLFAPATWRHR